LFYEFGYLSMRLLHIRRLHVEWHVCGSIDEVDDHIHAFLILVGYLANDESQPNERTNKLESRRDPVQSDMTDSRHFLPKDAGRLVHLEIPARCLNFHIPLTLLPTHLGPPPPPPSTHNVNQSANSEVHHHSLPPPTSSVSTPRLLDHSHIEKCMDREVAYRPKRRLW
jgi:hypothetical protein